VFGRSQTYTIYLIRSPHKYALMMSTKLPLLIMLGLVAFSMMGPAQGCVGGEGHHTYLKTTLVAGPSNYSASSFNITKDSESVHIHYNYSITIRILTDAQMTDLRAGKNYTWVWPKSTWVPDGGGNVGLTKGTYWACLFNDQDGTMTVPIRIDRPASLCGAIPVISENYQVSFIALALIFALVAVAFRR
jgi:hypothetical protein